MHITLIGLGIKDGDMTLSAERALSCGAKIMARTSHGEAYARLGGREVEYLDDVYARSRNFDTLNKNLAKRVLDAAKTQPVVYCVDGSVGEDEGCKIILSKCRDCTVIEGVSKISHIKCAARLRHSCVTALSAYDISSLKSCPAAVIYDLDDFYLASEVKQKLTDIFGEECGCTFIEGDSVHKIKVYEIDRFKTYSADCAVAIEEGEFLKKQRYDYADLEHMVALLRAPGGCPWDRAQTNDSIKGNMIEEAYELVDAINRGDDDGIEEECGDVLLQAAFHSVMKSEQGAFNGGDVLTRVVKKLIFRHSHIFGGDKAADEGAALGVWEKNKMKEKHQTTYTESLKAVPINFPACMRAQKVGKRAAKSGMDFLSPLSASERMGEEVVELLKALQAEDKEGVFEEAGDVLLSAVNTCRLAGVDCEQALAAATDKFIARFAKFEELVLADGKACGDLCDEEYDWYWLQAKNAIKGN